MSKSQTVHRCAECGAVAPRWVGRCPTCGAWNTLAEEKPPPAAVATNAAVPIGQAPAESLHPVPTGLAEVDRVLGGGLVPGSVTLLGGEPGVGKSTLLLQLLGRRAASGARTLLVSAEESAHQVRLRAERLETIAAESWLVAETEVGQIEAHVEQVRPELLVVDSIQAVSDGDLGSEPGSVTQVRGCAHRLVRLAKDRNITTVLVGHVTKDGSLAGPRVLEHLVDTVLSFSGERHHALRLLRAVKHRFGPTTELGLFEMSEGGLEAVADAGHLFLSDRREGLAGSVVAPIVDGRRPLLVEVQALVAPAFPSAPPRRTAQGIDASKLHLLLAVLDRRARLRTATKDVYAMAVGGARVADPAADLALALAIASSAYECPIPADLVACGELGLGGELRQVPQLGRRLEEAARMGFRAAIVPPAAPPAPEGMETFRAPTLAEALAFASRGLTVSSTNR